jgi:O-antigen ligase
MSPFDGRATVLANVALTDPRSADATTGRDFSPTIGLLVALLVALLVVLLAGLLVVLLVVLLAVLLVVLLVVLLAVLLAVFFAGLLGAFFLVVFGIDGPFRVFANVDASFHQGALRGHAIERVLYETSSQKSSRR